MDQRLDELLIYHEELRERGEMISPEELCRACPELLEEVKREIAALAWMDRMLAQPPEPSSAPSGGAAALPSIPGFEILEELGRGGMGVVYKARQVSLKRLVALKMLLAGSHASSAQQARLRTEAEAVARVRHPHIVQIHDIGMHEGKPFLVMEYVEGVSLDKAIESRWPPRQAAALAAQIARAVHAAHQAGIIHRDLKPANILLVSGGVVSGEWPSETSRHSPLTNQQAKVTDFGLAKQLADASGQTQSGAVLGTPSYMAPEQAAGRLDAIGPWTDVYSLGALLYELLTGRPPFKADSVLATLEQVRTRAPTPPRQIQPDVPPDLETICLRALHKEPARRFATAQGLADDLERCLRGEAIRARPDPVLRRIWFWLRRDDRIRDAGLVMLVNAAVRTVAITQLVRVLAGADLQREPWLPAQLAVWLVGMCVALYWAAWRTLGRHVVALWAGLALAVVYLSTRSVSTFLEADDERIFLYSLLFAAQLLTCVVGLLAYYARRSRQ